MKKQAAGHARTPHGRTDSSYRTAAREIGSYGDGFYGSSDSRGLHPEFYFSGKQKSTGDGFYGSSGR